MAGAPATLFRSVIDTVQPPPRIVDWSIFVIVCFEATTGLVSFTLGSPTWWPLFWAHRIAGLSLIILLGFKLGRVSHRLTNPDSWRPTTLLSVLTVVAVFGTIGTAILWVLGLDIRIAYWTLLSVHVGFGLLLVPLMVLHLTTKFRLPRREDFHGRRTAIQYSVFLIFGALAYRGQEFISHYLTGPGSPRRFTGSQPRRGDGNDSFPVTSWVADDPDPIDRSAWSLSVRGLVDTPLDIEYHELTTDSNQRALLDCTSGWYTEQHWQGISIAELLDAVGVSDDARYVRFVSVTGYRWSLPITEARETLLATHVGGEQLSHGHGAPLRLVAPGRRGFQWVKWVTRVEVRQRPDPAQWIVTLISGFDS